jgi:hypothetical protein
MSNECMEIWIIKAGRELHIHWACTNQEGFALPNFEHQFRAELGYVVIEFWINGIPYNGMLTAKLRHITV